jgi:hypothetical protein
VDQEKRRLLPLARHTNRQLGAFVHRQSASAVPDNDLRTIMAPSSVIQAPSRAGPAARAEAVP